MGYIVQVGVVVGCITGVTTLTGFSYKHGHVWALPETKKVTLIMR